MQVIIVRGSIGGCLFMAQAKGYPIYFICGSSL